MAQFEHARELDISKGGLVTYKEAAVYWMNRWDTETQELQIQLTDAHQTIASLTGLNADLRQIVSDDGPCYFCGSATGHAYNCGQGGGR